MSLPVMILAAGFGARMGALTSDRPKALIEVAGKALIDHALDLTASHGPVAVNGHYRAAQLAAHLAGRGTHFLHELPDILDSGGAVRNALPILGDGRFATLNADAVWSGPNVLDQLCAQWQPEMGGLLALVPMARAVGRQGGGDFRLERDGRLQPDKAGHVYTGAQILAGGVVSRWRPGQFSMWEIWQSLLAEDRLFGCLYPGYWADVGHPEGIALAENMLETPHA
ncbi:MAG: nucleotidyltransferase family protein [Pseudomonadota bacterium]